MTYCVHLCFPLSCTLFLHFSVLLCLRRTLSAYLSTGRGASVSHAGACAAWMVTLAQSSSIAPDSSPRRVHLDAAVRDRLLRRAHLESLQYPASTSRGKYTSRVHVPLRSSIRFSAPWSLCASSFFPRDIYRLTLFFPRFLLPLDRTIPPL